MLIKDAGVFQTWDDRAMFLPILTQTLESSFNASTVVIREVSSCDELDKCRTIWNIIWSSLATIFACTWVSIHPNIPAPEDSWGTKFARRVWITILALLAPELIVGWAARQWIFARRIAEANKGERSLFLE